jgi:SWI/SNF-related matrix-associated actin-dependent regulator 1 of chromatin subfamily A
MPTLASFQESAVDTLAKRLTYRRAGFLWSDMGTGKTPIMIKLADRLGGRMRVVFCPAIARFNWAREIGVWSSAGLPVFIVGVDGDVPPSEWSDGWVIVNYERVRDGNKALVFWLKRPWSIAFIDEHQYLANPDAQRTNHFYSAHPSQGGRLAEWFDKAVLASGTPMRNSPRDIWCHLIAWAPDTIDRMSLEAYTERFCIVQPKTLPTGVTIETIIGGRNEDELAKRLDGAFVRHRREDVLAEMPDLLVIPWWQRSVGLLEERIGALADILEIDPLDTLDDIADALDNTDDGTAVYGVLELMGLSHVDAVLDMVSDLVGTDEFFHSKPRKVLIFAHHKSVMDALLEKLINMELRPVEIRGGQDARTRQIGIDRFQNDPTCRAAIVQLQVGATAVTLTAASDAIFCEMDWTATNNVQCIARAYARLNDPHPLTVRLIQSDDWLSRGQSRLIARRLETIGKLVPGSIEAALHSALSGRTEFTPPVKNFGVPIGQPESLRPVPKDDFFE